MKMTHTPAQLEAITSRNEDILVSAAAGSGKTRVLVDRIVRLLVEDRVSLRNMLVVTFTNAAAGEMKERLEQSLIEALAEATDREQMAFLRTQLRELNQAQVSTMHAFCMQQLRTYYYHLDIEPNFRILSGTGAAILESEALEQVFEDAYSEAEDDFLELVEAFGGNYHDAHLREMVRRLAQFAVSREAPARWLETQSERWLEDWDVACFMAFQQQVEADLELVRANIETGLELVDEDERLRPYAETFAGDVALIAVLEQAVRKSPERAFEAFSAVKFERLATVRKIKDEAVAEVQDRIKAIREMGVKKPVENLQNMIPAGGMATVLRARQRTGPRIVTLMALVQRFRAAYATVKRKKNGLDFADLEHHFLHLMTSDEVRKDLKARIGYIFFDEYQDANPIQEAIVETLAHPGRLFFVGDVKQAIYRFRMADPALFNRRYERYLENDGAERVIFLSENFRSRQEILAFINRLFTFLMTPALGDVDYLEPGQALVCGQKQPPLDEAVSLVFLRGEDERAAGFSVEGLWMAQEIKRLVTEGGYRYGDVAILMRSPRARLLPLEAALRHVGVPFYSDNTTVDFDNMEVRLFLDLLRVVNNHFDDEALLAVLQSPIIGFSEEELAMVRLAVPDGSYAEAFNVYGEGEEDVLAARIRSFFETLGRLRQRQHMLVLADFAAGVLTDSGLQDFLLALDEGEARLENVRAVIDLMAQFEREQVSGLSGFLYYVETLSQRPGETLSPAPEFGEAEDRVRIMSIHKSKGLGFNVVFLAGLGHRFNYLDSQKNMVLHGDLGLALKAVNLELGTAFDSFEKRVIARRLKDETRSEEARLLYVALTRAKDRLYLLAHDKKNPRPEEAADGAGQSAARTANAYLTWLNLYLTAANGPQAGMRIIEETVGDLLDGFETDDGVGDVVALSAANPINLERIHARFDFVYPFLADTREPYKKTVSQLSQENRISDGVSDAWPPYFSFLTTPQPLAMPRPAFLSEALHLSAAETGTVLHKVMQNLPLTPMDLDGVKMVLMDLEARGVLSPVERAAVDPAIPLAFLENPLGQQVIAHHKYVEREVPFTMLYEHHLVDGQIDLFYEDEAGYHIVDFKSDRVRNGAQYRLQLALYQKALSQARNKPVVDAVIYWLRHNISERIL